MQLSFRVLTQVTFATIGMILAACTGVDTTPAGKPLYDRLGGKTVIAAVVEQFVANVVTDTRINARFAATDIVRLKGHLVDQMCTATGGPCIYKGRDMKTTHAGMRITDADFDALVEDLVGALDRFKVPAKEKGELMALLGPMKKDIVE